MASVARDLQRLGDAGDDGGRLVHEGDQVVDEQRALVDRAGGGDQRADAVGHRGDGPGEERVVADHDVPGEYLHGDEHVEDEVRHPGHHADGDVPCALGEDQPAQPPVVGPEDLQIPPDEGVRQVIHADLLDHVLVDQQAGVVVHLPPFLGAAAHVLEVLAAVDEVDDRRGDGDGDDDQRRPGQARRGEQDDEVADELDHRADHAEGLRQNLKRAHAGLAAGVFHALVEGGIVEGGHVQGLRLLHDLRLDLAHHQFARDAVQRTADLVDDLRDDAVDEQEDQQAEDIRLPEAFRRQRALCHDPLQAVEHACGDQCADNRRHAPKERHEGQQEQDPPARAPDEPDDVAETAEETAQQLGEIAGNVGNALGRRDFLVVVGAGRALHGGNSFRTVSGRGRRRKHWCRKPARRLRG